jgi:hypothetical protein
VNVAQLRLSIAQMTEMLGLVQESLEQLHHMADHGGIKEASKDLAQATASLGEVRSRLEAAAEGLEGHKAGPDISVERVS